MTDDNFSDPDDYENLDLSFDDIQGFPSMISPVATTTESTASDPTIFTKPGIAKPCELDEDYILGTLVVRVVAARDLEPAESVGSFGNLLFGGGSERGKKHGTCHPYASVRFGETTQRTSTIYNSLDPIWPRGETMYMDVTHPPTESVTQASAPIAAPSEHENANYLSRSARQHSETINNDARRSHQAPILTVALFHATDFGHKAAAKSHAPVKKNQGDSDDVFLGMLTVDMTSLITGKLRTFDEWISLSGGSSSMRTNRTPSVRIVAEYEASDAPPHKGDLVRFTRFCEPADLYPALVDGYYAVVEDGVGNAGDNVLISFTSQEGWVSTFQCHRFMLICVERHTSSLDHLENEVISIAQRLSVSPAVNAVQETLDQIPDDGLVSVGATVIQGAGSLWSRWKEGGLTQAVEDMAHVTNWDGRFNPSTADHLSDSFNNDEGRDSDDADQDSDPLADPDSLYYSDDSDSPQGQALPNMPSCPITQQPMRDPVVAADGHTYERTAIVRWLKTSDKSPLTGSLLPHKNLVPNYMLLSSIQESSRLMSANGNVTRQDTNGLNGGDGEAEEDAETMDVKID
ncbi:hypothetical protein MPSEU_000471200 [Mayamaea pseudoterrestris]|nr:hypothetical protein MPSEU_000471200 [Mayamaea pseudoterrestris]